LSIYRVELKAKAIKTPTNFGREIVLPADLCYNGDGDEYGKRKRIATKKKIKIAKF
jgi:hypothetical protein